MENFEQNKKDVFKHAEDAGVTFDKIDSLQTEFDNELKKLEHSQVVILNTIKDLNRRYDQAEQSRVMKQNLDDVESERYVKLGERMIDFGQRIDKYIDQLEEIQQKIMNISDIVEKPSEGRIPESEGYSEN